MDQVTSSKHKSLPIEPFAPQELGPKDWGTELLIGHTEHYTLKRLAMNAGYSGPLQYHEQKDETFYLESGQAWVDHDDGNGLLRTLMTPGQSFRIPPGAVHRVTAISNCVFFEASIPVFEDRKNVEAQYEGSYPPDWRG